MHQLRRVLRGNGGIAPSDELPLLQALHVRSRRDSSNSGANVPLSAPSRLLPTDRVARSALTSTSTRAVERGGGFGATVYNSGFIAAVAAAINGLSYGRYGRSREVSGARDD